MKQQNYEKKYSDSGFLKKGVDCAKTAGKDVIEKALYLYYAYGHPNVPVWAKTTIVGALGYFISPIDAIPDFTPIVGYADDLGVLVAAVAAVSMYIDADVKKKAKMTLKEWFGD